MRLPSPAATAAALAALALTACATGHRQPEVALPAAFEAPAPVAGAVELDRWWTAFGDPQLTALIEGALVEGFDARIAAARLAEARAVRSSQLTAFLPQGNLTGSGRRTETEQLEGTAVDIPGFSTSGTSEQYQANFNVSWEIDLFGRIFAANRATRADVAAARFAFEGARASLAAAVADAYFQARGLAIQLGEAEETARIQRELLEIARIRAERGLGATSDADRVAGDLAQAESQVQALQGELQAARRSLLVLVGRGTDPLADLTVPASVGEAPPAPRTLPGELLARRPDVREAEARFRGQLGRKDLAAKAFFPTFTLTPGLGIQRQVQPSFESTSSSWSIGAGVTIPVLDIPRLLAELRAQDARTEQAALTYERAVQTAYGEAENALVRLDADRRRVALLTEGERRAQRAYEAARIRYSRGLGDLQTALSAEQAWRATRSQLTAAQVQAVRRAVQAYQAVGGGWPASTASAPGGGG
ncbi:TolC family protein [Phenylobacterium sp.]|jgi:NodT family efflux transporter outer membrane factor (OMF) lipoprotein|uniref:TolC family protein n=1 Tax=Phenylobacterium sp. TaxID=1871053 RepID=UPI002E338424|nr:TolC family protein [Phenylobacterium sp.]HEX2558678.1 TolC family protein [Phenylobacterium sp.]